MGVPFLVYALAMPVDSELRCQGSHHQRSRRPVVSWVLHYYVQGGSDLLPLEEEQRIAEKQSHGLLLAVRSFALCQACVGRIFLFLMGDKGAVYLTLLAHTLYVPVACVRDYTSGELCMALLPEGTSEAETLETLLQKPRLDYHIDMPR